MEHLLSEILGFGFVEKAAAGLETAKAKDVPIISRRAKEVVDGDEERDFAAQHIDALTVRIVPLEVGAFN
jgi:hypothetical protein